MLVNIGNIILPSHNQQSLKKITVLWAFGEAALGGILHAFKIPLTGLLIGSIAVLSITLIAYFSNSRIEIVKITLRVMLIKLIVSPYSPVTAYFAVALQGVLGYLLFYQGFNRVSPVVLGVLSLSFSAVQKIFILTIVFGNTLWESIDIFFNFVLSDIFKIPQNLLTVNLSYLAITLYFLVHFIVGIIIGFYASNFPAKLLQSIKSSNRICMNYGNDLTISRKSKRKNWWRKPSSIFLFIVSFTLIILSFTIQQFDKSIGLNIVVMFIRSIIIIVAWYYFISPVLLKLIRKYLLKRGNLNTQEIEEVINLFPSIKLLLKHSWEQTKSKRKLKRILKFIDNSLVNFFSSDLTSQEK